MPHIPPKLEPRPFLCSFNVVKTKAKFLCLDQSQNTSTWIIIHSCTHCKDLPLREPDVLAGLQLFRHTVPGDEFCLQKSPFWLCGLQSDSSHRYGRTQKRPGPWARQRLFSYRVIFRSLFWSSLKRPSC